MRRIQHILLLLVCTTTFAQNKATHSLIESIPKSSEQYQSMTFNGVWSWFSDPRAVYYEGKHKRTYAGWIDNYGDVHIGYYDHDTQKIASKVIYDNLEIDDHDNPSILFDEGGKLLVFFNTHLQDQKPLFMRISTNPEDIEAWQPLQELYLNDDSRYENATINRHTYTNPVRLSKEAGKLYLFWRGINLKPSYSVSIDNGKTWSKGKILYQPEKSKKLKAPYTKVYSDGDSKIHFTFTDGHPTQEKKNALYYMYYENGAFYKANGEKIKNITELPVLQSEMDVIHQSDTIKVWNWDIAQDANGNPIVTYVTFPKENKHRYVYASFHDNKWKSYDVITVDGAFPETRPNTDEPEPHYAGGIVIDHETPNRVYLSAKRKDVFEIEEWTTQNRGKSWNVKKITENSTKNNVRPFAVRGAKKDNPVQVLWLQNTKYVYYAHDTRGQTIPLDFKNRYHTAVKMNLLKAKLKDELTKENLIQLLRTVAEYQLENPDYTISQNDRQFGILYAGLNAFTEITNEARYRNELLNIRQYQKEEDEDEDEIDIKSIIWSYSVQNNRNYLQRLEEFTINDFEYYDIGLDCASMIRAIENFDKSIIKIEEIKEKFKINIKAAVIELENYDESKLTMSGKAFLIYALAKSIHLRLLGQEHKDLVIQSWRRLQTKLLEKDAISRLTLETRGAILLAGKEVYEILNSKQ